jgi:CDP-paratose 2-epimerase
MDVIGIDNNLREYFFGPDRSTRWTSAELTKSLSRYRHFDLNIRELIFNLFGRERGIALVVHCTSQPITDFMVNACGQR